MKKILFILFLSFIITGCTPVVNNDDGNSVSIDNADTNNYSWITITNNEGIIFQYPKELLVKYISETEWPPVISIDPKEKDQEFVCVETAPESSLAQRTSRRTVDDRSYCLYASSEGAAGSVYTNYTYSALWDGRIVKVNFTLRYPGCDNYDEPQKTECQKEREAFDLDGVVDRIAQSIKVN